MSITRQNLSVIIVSFKSDHVIHKCINSIDNQMEIIVVDNNSKDKSVEEIKAKFSEVKIIQNTINLGFSKGVNKGFKEYLTITWYMCKTNDKAVVS